MNTYLTIMVTILVLTQIVRIDAYDIAVSALRIQQKQESECANCSGIVYRQTDSGKIIPVDQRCGVKITPPCYVPDGDGCAYQIYGDNNDEPIARCKSCPLCQSDKIRHKQEPAHNDPLTLDELMQMDGKPVWVICDEGFEPLAFWALVEVCEESIFLTNNLGGRTEYAADVELEEKSVTTGTICSAETGNGRIGEGSSDHG